MPTLFLDENVKAALAPALIAVGIPTLTTHGEDRLGMIDAAHLSHCANLGWVLVTQNRRDFLALHEGWVTWTAEWGVRREHNGILILDQGPGIAALVTAIVPFLASGQPLINRVWNWFDNPPDWQEFIIGGSKKRI